MTNTAHSLCAPSFPALPAVKSRAICVVDDLPSLGPVVLRALPGRFL